LGCLGSIFGFALIFGLQESMLPTVSCAGLRYFDSLKYWAEGFACSTCITLAYMGKMLRCFHGFCYVAQNNNSLVARGPTIFGHVFFIVLSLDRSAGRTVEFKGFT
jgi:hypothetical protein